MKPRFNISFLLSISAMHFLGNLGFGLLFPSFSYLFFNPQPPFLFSSSFRFLELAFLISLFPFFQFLGGKVFLFWNTRYLQKHLYLWACFGIAVSLWWCAYTITEPLYPLLLLSISFAGFFAGSIALSIPPFPQASPFGWMFGVFMGGIFSNQQLFPTHTLATPFWISGFIAFFILIFLAFSFPKEKSALPPSRLGLVENKKISASYFFLLLGWVILLQFFPIYFFTLFPMNFLATFSSTLLMTLAFLFGRLWLAPFSPSSHSLFLTLFTGITFFISMSLVTKHFFLSLFFHILIALYVGVLTGMFTHSFSFSPFFYCSTFSLAPLLGTTAALFQIHFVYILIAISFLIGLIIVFSNNEIFIRK